MITRRRAIKTTVLAAAAVALATPRAHTQSPPPAAGPEPFTLPPLPYPFDALEPHIDARTMEIHHDKHHQAYVTNLNKAVAGHPHLAKQTVEELVAHVSSLPEPVRAAIQNNGGGHYNHSLFWRMMSGKSRREPGPEFAATIERHFKSFAGFKEQLAAAASTRFGSGWAWLTIDAEKKLGIESTANQDSPLSMGKNVLLGLDVWEHAYYLKYQNRRADYVNAFFSVINWDYVTERFRMFGG